MPTSTLDHLTQRLLDWYQTQSWAVELEALTPVVFTELARGEPVDAARIAVRAGMPTSDVLGLLRRSPAEWDADGRLVGFGLTLRPTRHRFEVDGRVLYTTAHPEGIVVSVADAFTLTRRLSARWFQAAAQDEDGPSLEAA
jgi:hypothetical protein